MHIADYQQGDYYCEASLDLKELLWTFKETDTSYCDWKLQRSFPYWRDFLNFIANHCPQPFVESVKECLYATPYRM